MKRVTRPAIGFEGWWTEVKKHGRQLSGQERFDAALGGLVSLVVYSTAVWVITTNLTLYFHEGVLNWLVGAMGITFFPAFAAFLFWRAFW